MCDGTKHDFTPDFIVGIPRLIRTCTRCKADMSGEKANAKTICFACQRRTIKNKYKRIYAKRKGNGPREEDAE